MTISLFNEPKVRNQASNKVEKPFDVFKAIQKGFVDSEEIDQISKVPWFSMWARKELRKSFAKSKLTREQVLTFNASMKTSYTSDQVVSKFAELSELDKFLGMITNMSVSDHLKTKVILSVLYPKLKLKE